VLTPPDIVLLTEGGDYGRRIAIALGLRGVPLRAVVLALPVGSSEGNRHRLLKIGPRRIVAAVLRRGLRLLEAPRAAAPPLEAAFDGLANEVIAVRGLNSPEMIAALAGLRPTYLLLGGVGIVKPPILEVPSRGTINVHPALLPWCRGTGVVARSLERNIPAGVTAHYVNAGIDTGSILRRELIPIAPHDTLASIETKAEERSVQLMAELAAQAVHAALPAGFNQEERHAYCRWATPDERLSIERRIRAGAALRLYQQWLGLSGSASLDRAFVPPADSANRA
jgi:methionyl-tRNA formyltransferase